MKRQDTPEEDFRWDWITVMILVLIVLFTILLLTELWPHAPIGLLR